MIIHDITRLIVLLSLHIVNEISNVDYYKILSGDGSGHRGDTLQGFACALSAFLLFFHVVEKSLDRKGIDLDMTGSRKAIYFIILCLVWPLMLPLEVQASPPDRSDGYTLPPHLIQSVTEQDLYEGMVCLGMLECPVLQEADCEKAFENVKDCVVRVIMGNAYGSGILWELTADRVIIATNSHVLAYWQQEDSCLLFPQGYFVEAKVLGLSSQYDVGFLEVDNGQFTYAELERLRSAAVEAEGYEQLEPGMSMFCVGAGPEAGEMLFHEAELEDRARYIADFGAVMLYGYGFARTGMSGGGMFDGYGRLIGMVTGGTQQNEVAGVPLPSMEEAYQEVVNEASRFAVQSE